MIRHKEVTNSIDRIYGVIGLINLALKEPMIVDVSSTAARFILSSLSAGL